MVFWFLMINSFIFIFYISRVSGLFWRLLMLSSMVSFFEYGVMVVYDSEVDDEDVGS